MLRRRRVALTAVLVTLAPIALGACSSAKSGSGATSTSAPAASASSSVAGSSAPAVSRPAPSAATPQVTGPIPGPGLPAIFASYPLATVGYTESESFISGTATAYTSAAPLGKDGDWTVTPASKAAYKTRMIVARPIDPAEFDGTVIVEWLNVTSGSDADVDWDYGHNEMIRSGDAYVGVSVQAAGLNSAKKADPTRYASLVHPGDSYSYDIYSQAGMAVRNDAATILGGLKPKLVIADGESQSAIRMTTYVDAIAPLSHVYDAYMIHSRAGMSAALSQAPLRDIEPPKAAVLIRTDQTVPVMVVASETDVLGVLDYFPAVQADSSSFRLWEIAGTAHVDSYVALQAQADNGGAASDRAQYALLGSPTSKLSVSLPSGPLVLNCPAPFNAGEHHYVFDTAIHDLIGWAQTGVPPRSMPRFEIDTSGTTPSYRLDANGNVLGGIRTPAVDAPVAVLSGLAVAGGPTFCEFFGQTHEFSAAKLAVLYPTHADFVTVWDAAVKKDLAAGYLLPGDAAKLTAAVGR